MNVPTYNKFLIATDAPIFIAPSFENKAEVRQNAIDPAISLSLPIDLIHCTPKLQRIGTRPKDRPADRLPQLRLRARYRLPRSCRMEVATVAMATTCLQKSAAAWRPLQSPGRL